MKHKLKMAGLLLGIALAALVYAYVLIHITEWVIGPSIKPKPPALIRETITVTVTATPRG